MKRKAYITIFIIILVSVSIAVCVVVNQLRHLGSTTGGRGPDYPYFITTEQTTVKKIVVPKGTKLTYEEHFFKEGQQTRLMNEKKLTSIKLPEGKTIDWAGVPVVMIVQFYNPEMQGYSVYPDFKQLLNNKRTKFSQLWQNCNSDLGVTVKNTDDWTSNPKNIHDISSCGVNYQRYFKEDKEQQHFLDELYKELKK